MYVLADDIDASHVALSASVGNVVMGVFHTLSDGKAGQFVPGNIGPASLTDAVVTAGDRVVASDVPGATTSTRPSAAAVAPMNCTRREVRWNRRCTMKTVYFVFARTRT